MDQQMLMQPVEAAELAAVNGGFDLVAFVIEVWHQLTAGSGTGTVINCNQGATCNITVSSH
jgi:hypothetical protein